MKFDVKHITRKILDMLPSSLWKPIYSYLNPYRPEAYWEKRHRSIKDIRSVGNSGKSVEENEEFHRRVQKVIRPFMDGDGKLLDAGCGIGVHSRFFSGIGYSVTGIDISETAISNAQINNSDCDFLCGNLSSIPFHDGYFDVVVALEVLVHIVDKAEFQKSVSELCRVVKPGGLIIYEGNYSESDDKTNFHVKIRGKVTYDKAFLAHGCILLDFRKFKSFEDQESALIVFRRVR